MEQTVGESLARRLVAWGVDTVYGLPGDGINGLMEGFRRASDELEFVLVHHEEAAAFMATAHAKATGRLGVCCATSGPGAIHLLNGLYDAKLDHAPVLAITGMQETSVLGTRYQQEVHLPLLYQDVADYNLQVNNPQQMPSVVDLAIRNALAKQTVSHLTFPNDVQLAPVDQDPFAHPAPASSPTTGVGRSRPHLEPDAEAVAAAVALLEAAERPAILAGVGALHAREEVAELSERLGAPIIKTLPGKAVVPDDHPNTTGGIGLLGTKPSEQLVDDCDALVMVGTSFPYTKHLLARPGEGGADRRGPVAHRAAPPRRRPAARRLEDRVRALLDRLAPQDQAHLERYREKMADWRKDMAALEDPDRSPIAPQYLMHAIDEAAASDAVLTCDSGTIATWAARHWTIRGDREFYLSGNLATMAPGLPYAIAIQHAQPNRQVIAFVGDGGFAMLMAEMLTAVRNELPIKVVVNNNNSYGQILWEQMVLGYPEYKVRHQDPEPDFAAWATACGAFGAKVTDPHELPGAIRSLLDHPGPGLIDCSVNPNEPPMPGQITYEQAKHFAQAFLRGQPHKASTLAAIAGDKIRQLAD
ncbi:MAG: thiamine pyrophosphate-binding protein [Acidimicrobiales bacterium]